MGYKTGEYIGTKAARSYDQGLREYMLRVYNYMAGGLAITGLFAVLVASSEVLSALLYTPAGGMTSLGLVVSLAPLGFSLVLGFQFERMSLATIKTIYWLYSACMGLSLSYLFLYYTGASIVRIFFMTSSIFAGMSLYGYTTKKDLTTIGSFLTMGLFGIMICGLVNLFIGSSALYFITSVVGLFIFIGLVAFYTQDIKNIYYMLGDSKEGLNKAAVMSALTLYLSFISIFIRLLQLFGDRREN